jgi:2-polyprenyl-3-methyl-5-hydroxy-6-metoxy-1,4-benzoquinol methylase
MACFENFGVLWGISKGYKYGVVRVAFTPLSWINQRIRTKKMSERVFDKYERKGAYHWSDYYGGLRAMNAYTRARYDIVCRCVGELRPSPKFRLLDLGCGDGALAGVLHRQLGATVSGVDTSVSGLSLAREMFAKRGLHGTFKVIDGYDTGFADQSFDVVVCSDVIEHVNDPMAMLTESYRVLAPNGHLVITTPIRFTEHPLDPNHVQEWYVDEFVSLCSQIFGSPLHAIQSHPILWYELVTSRKRWLGRIGRFMANVLTRLGANPFLQQGNIWRCYTTQTLVLGKKNGNPRSKVT